MSLTTRESTMRQLVELELVYAVVLMIKITPHYQRVDYEGHGL